MGSLGAEPEGADFNLVFADRKRGLSSPGDGTKAVELGFCLANRERARIAPMQEGVVQSGGDVIGDKFERYRLILPQQLSAPDFQAIDGDGKQPVKIGDRMR